MMRTHQKWVNGVGNAVGGPQSFQSQPTAKLHSNVMFFIHENSEQ